MRRTALIAIALVTVLALSVGAIALPLTLGTPPMSPATSAPARNQGGTSPAGKTPSPTPPSPPGNATVQHNVTVVSSNRTIWINGTIVVFADNRTVVNLTFRVVVKEGIGANVSFNGTIDANGTMFTVGGVAMLEPAIHSIDIHGLLSVSRNGTTLVQRSFESLLVWDQSGAPTFTVEPLPGVLVDVATDHL